MASMEDSFARACRDRKIPGAVVLAEGKNGSFHYENAFGYSLPSTETSSEKPLAMDTVFQIASCTKLLTSISAMQCVERGLVKLDDDLADIVPELAALEIVGSFDYAGKAAKRKRKNPITLRHLLTHSSGLGYDFMSPKLAKYRKSIGERIGGKGRTLADTHSLGLLFEPGTSWNYGCSTDWVGRVVERVSGKDLEQYMKENLFAPLGIKDLTFWLRDRPDMQARLSNMTIRDPNGSGKVVYRGGPMAHEEAIDCFGGGGCWGTMPEYLKVLRSLLNDDEKLLKKETAANMFSPHLTSAGAKFLDSLRDRPEVWGGFVGHFPRHVGLDWGLGGILTTGADEGWRGKHTMIWSGLYNLFWFIDREVGICGVYGGHVLPPGDAQTNEMITVFEKAMYSKLSEAQPKL